MSLMDLKAEVAEIYGLKERVSSGEEEVRGRLDVLRKSILRGGSTGDPITDFVVASQGDLSEESEQHYRNLQKMIRGKEGEPIFVARIKGDYDHHREPEFMFETLMYIGVLDSETLGFYMGGEIKESGYYAPDLMFKLPYRELHDVSKHPHMILPTSEHVIKETYFRSQLHTTSHDTWNLTEGDIRISALEMVGGMCENYDSMVRANSGAHSFSDSFNRSVVIKVGNKQVREFFKNQRQHEIEEYERAVRLLE